MIGAPLLRSKGLEARERRLAFYLLAPVIIGLLALLAYPTIQTILWSLSVQAPLNAVIANQESPSAGLKAAQEAVANAVVA